MTDIIETLTSNGKRAKVHDAVLIAKVPKKAKLLIGTLADDRQTSEAAIVREALAEYFERRGYLG